MKTITFIFTTKQTSDPSSSSLVMDEVKYYNEQTPSSRGRNPRGPLVIMKFPIY